MNRLYLDFYDVKCLIESDNKDVLELLGKDFSLFKVPESNVSDIDFHFTLHAKKATNEKVVGLTCMRRSKNSLTYEDKNIRYNDYYGKLFSIYDYDNDTCEIYSTDNSKSHEILYLLIHSRVGKKLDLMGLHRVHAMAVRKDGKTLVVMMPSGGGKSTLLKFFLKDQSVEFLSDDCPLVDAQGRVYPFPIRLGISDRENLKVLAEDEKCFYEMDRENLGLKHLLDSSCLTNPKAFGAGENVVLVNGRRTHKEGCEIKRIGRLKMLSHLFRHMIIGIGLPMILEYWWETGLDDFVRKARIGVKRFFSATALCLKADRFEIELGENPELNYKTLKNFLNW